jgi:hypothetical protein
MKFILPIFLLSVSFAHAQDYSSAASASASSDGGQDAVIVAQECAPVEYQPAMTAAELIDEWFDNWAEKVKEKKPNQDKPSQGWNAETNRSIQVEFAGANIEAADPNFANIRQSLLVRAQLQAKAAIIESFLTTASASNILTIPGNPIEAQVRAERQAYQDMQASADSALAQSKATLQSLSGSLDQAVVDEIAGIGYNDRAKALFDGVIKKLDKDYSTEKLGEEQANKIARLKKAVKAAAENQQKAELAKAEYDQAAEDALGVVQEKLESNIETLSEMPLFGAVTLEQAESYDDLDGYLEVAVVVAWSPGLEMEARSILLGENELKPRPTKKSLNEWIDNLDLSVSVGSRRYLPSNGSINFVGIAAARYNPRDRTTMSFASKKAQMMAKQQAILSLFADVESAKKMNTSTVIKMGKGGKSSTQSYENLSERLSESVENIQVSGLSIVHKEKVVHPATGHSMYVAVASINSDLAAKAFKLQADSYATLKEINESQSYRKGQVEGMKAVAASAKNDSASRAAGQADGASAVSSEYNSRNPKPTAAASNVRAPRNQGSVAPVRPAKVQSGAFLSGSDDIDDDF